MSVSTKEMPAFIYQSIRISFEGEMVVFSQWCRAGRELFTAETLGL
ncbi:hypothetical protein G6M16_008840 [Agrobacterium tumefaciens]|nr:hypothetical protein G6M16_008840 [Agrobacterium tumefaciens]